MNEILHSLKDKISKNPNDGFVENFKSCSGVECFQGTERKKYQGFIFESISEWEAKIDPEFDQKVECVNPYSESKKSILWHRDSDRTILKLDEVPDHIDSEMPEFNTYRTDICMFVIQGQ